MADKYEVVAFQTSDKLELYGLLHVPHNAKGVCVFMPGLTGNAFSRLALKMGDVLAKNGYGVLILNARGAGIVNSFHREDKRKPKGYRSELIGTALEQFTDCLYDIDGAVDFLKSRKVKKIYLVGHSTGCQKSIYYASQRGKEKKVHGIVLLAPLSDYSIGVQDPTLKDKVGYARTLVQQGRQDMLLPKDIFGQIISAQRYISLNTVDSQEEIFTYASDKKPKTLQKVNTPTLTVIGEADEHLDRPVLELVEWFEAYVVAKKKRVEWMEGADHGFRGQEAQLGKLVSQWLETI